MHLVNFSFGGVLGLLFGAAFGLLRVLLQLGGYLLGRAAGRFGWRPVLLTLLGVWLVMAADSSHAQGLPTGVFDNVADGFKTVSKSWFDPLHEFGLRLFRLLAAIEIAWCAILWALEKQDMPSLFGALLKKIIGLNMFYALILFADTWIPAIINSFAIAGQTASGTSGLSPSDIITRGLDCAFRIFDAVSFLGLDVANTVVVGLTCLVLAVVIALTFAVIACQLLVALVESYFVLSAGVIFLGFGGSRWTNDFVQKYLGYAVATGVKLMMMYLIIGAANSISASWPDMLNASADNQAVLQTSLVVLIGSMMLAFLSWQIPALAASMLAGSPNLTAGSAATFGAAAIAGGVGTMAMGAKGVTGLASAASAGIGGVSAGMAQAVAANTAGSFGGVTGLGSSLGGVSGGGVQVQPPSMGTAGSTAGSAAGVTSAATVSPAGGTYSSGQQAQPPGATPAGSGAAGGTYSSGQQAQPPGAAPAGSGAATASPLPGDVLPGRSAPQAPPPTDATGKTGPGLLDRMQQVRPPQFPSDAPGGGTVHIRLDGGNE
jgi:type IV secretion system protein TrbL